jgi:hypothetical protein
MDRHVKTKSCFSQFCEYAYKMTGISESIDSDIVRSHGKCSFWANHAHTDTHTLVVTYFIYCSFNNTLYNSNYTAQDGKATSKKLTGNHDEGTGHGLTSGTTPTNQNSAVNTVTRLLAG